MRQIILLILLSVACRGYAQSLSSSIQGSSYRYVYRISNEEARLIHKKGLEKSKIDLMQREPIDSLKSSYHKDWTLPVGNFVEFLVNKGGEDYEYLYKHSCRIALFNDGRKVKFRAYNSNGRVIAATAFVNGSRLSMNGKDSCFSMGAVKKYKVLEVVSSGVSNFFIVLNDEGRYKPQPRYMRYFKKWYWKSLFDSDYSPSRTTYTGYAVFSKPKYRPGDTLKVKTFIVDSKGVPYNQPLSISIPAYQLKKAFKVSGVSPYRPGAYFYSIKLTDSLEMKLDRSYTLEFCSADKNQRLFSSNFYYEDYELNPLKLEVRATNDEHYRGKPMTLWIKGTNDNGMNLQDATVKITVTPASVEKTFLSTLSVADTLWNRSMPLEPAGETEVSIPDSIFANMNLCYNVKVDMVTSDNESLMENRNLNFYWSRKEIKGNIVGDSLDVRYLNNAKESPLKVLRIAYNDDNTEAIRDSIFLPVKFKLNPLVRKYEFRSSDGTCSGISDIDESSSGVNVLAQRTADSVFVRLINPNHVAVSYSIYRGKGKIAEGFADSLQFKSRISSDASCLVHIQYLWGGKTVRSQIPVVLNTRAMQLKLDVPNLIVPGQAADLKLTAKDFRGEKVADADVTLYGITGKFRNSTPSVFRFNSSKRLKYPDLSRNFTLPGFEEFEPNEDESYDERFSAWCRLRYSYWNPRLGLDSSEFYKFIYPKGGFYERVDAVSDSITQFAPFVVRGGQQQEIHVIYIDEVPAYYSWTTVGAPYSFRISEGFHDIKMRMGDRLITLKKHFFKGGRKTIFSLCDSVSVPDVDVAVMPNKLTVQEKQQLTRYIFPYRDITGAPFAYLNQNGSILMLKQDGKEGSRNVTGPVEATPVVMTVPNGYTTEFFGPEPGFEYEFFPRLIKMRSINNESLLPAMLGKVKGSYPFTDESLTEKKVQKMDSIYRINNRRAKYDSYPYYTTAGFGRIVLKTPDVSCDTIMPVNVVVYSLKDIFGTRIYQGVNRSIEMLPVDSYYRVNIMYKNKAMYIFDSLKVGAFRTLYLNIPSGDSLKATKQSISLTSIIDSLVYKTKEEIGVIAGQLNSYNPAMVTYEGTGVTISGYVVDRSDKQPIPGVVVEGTGTRYGVVTDLNGMYRIKVPYSVKSLTFKFIGYEPMTIRTDNTTELGQVLLKASEMHLDEVVVVGYGVQRKSALAGAVVSSDMGLILAEESLDDALAGRAAGVMIRGIGSMNDSSKPVYVVDGKVVQEMLSPELIETMEVLKGDPQLVGLYGSDAANGVVIITSKKSKGQTFDDVFMAQAMHSSGIRSRFADDAFWFPFLRTDANGEAIVRVKFPDDITSWKAYAIGVSDTKRLTGITSASINSMKPMNAALSLPRFMVAGDTVKSIGKVLNYTMDTLKVKTEFQVDGVTCFTKSKQVINSAIDTLQVAAPAKDSLKLQYKFEMANGYSDGEERSVNIVRKGLEKSVGIFRNLKANDSIAVRFDKAMGRVDIAVDATPLSLIKEKAQALIDYKYECNEQLASKLKGWLAMKEIKALQGERFKGDAEINRIIRKLKKGVNPDGLWGWWPGSVNSMEMSAHIIEALNMAENLGYKASIDFTNVKNELIYRLPNMKRYEMLNALNLLSLMNAKVDFAASLDTLKKPALTISEMVMVDNIRKRAELPVDKASLYRRMVKTVKGNCYLRDSVYRFLFFNDGLLTNINALKLVATDTSSDSKRQELLGYLLEYISDRSYMNTYEMSNFVTAAVPVLKSSRAKNLHPVLQISGDTVLTVSKFPFMAKSADAARLIFSNRADAPLYVSATQKTFIENPAAADSLFAISTYFKDDKGNVVTRLKGGEKVSMEVDIRVKRMAKYAMIRIPIPAGCTYASKEQRWYGEANREYFEDCVCIFVDNLMVSSYHYTINLMPRFDGTYTINPAKVEPMYSPSMMGNNTSKTVIIGKEAKRTKW